MIIEFQELNRKFDKGTLVNRGSLEFAISACKKTKNWQEQLAFILRALINDYVFADGNKRTATAYIMAVLEKQKLAYDVYKIDTMAVSIAKNRLTSIARIRRLIQNALR